MGMGDHIARAAALMPGDEAYPLVPTEFVDVHCHCLPNLDDGPTSMDEAFTVRVPLPKTGGTLTNGSCPARSSGRTGG